MLSLCVYGKWAAACLRDLGGTPGLPFLPMQPDHWRPGLPAALASSLPAIHRAALHGERASRLTQPNFCEHAETAVGQRTRPPPPPPKLPHNEFHKFLFTGVKPGRGKTRRHLPLCGALINDGADKRDERRVFENAQIFFFPLSAKSDAQYR